MQQSWFPQAVRRQGAGLGCRGGVVIALFALVLSLIGLPAPGWSLEGAPLRLGTGGAGGTYYPLGSALAESWTHGLNACLPECRETPFLSVAQFSNGSVSNVEGLASGALEGGLVQADVAYWAMTGTGIFHDRPPQENLRAIANLFPESLQIALDGTIEIGGFHDLAGLRISLDDRGSGTLVVAQALLAAHDMSEEDLEAEYLKPTNAVEKMRGGALDGFVIMAGYPTESISEISAERSMQLVPIAPEVVEQLAADHPYFAVGEIPEGVYPGVGRTPTLTVGAQLLVRADLSDDLVYDLTRLLWSEETLGHLATVHEKGRQIRIEDALQGLVVPLHSGAARYYRDRGVLN